MSIQRWFAGLIKGFGLILAGVLVCGGGLSAADESKPKVSLLLSASSGERREQDVLFRCEAQIDNATGKDLTVKSNFYSAFDGLELVVTDKDGLTLAQQPYIWHQSPFTPDGRDFVLKQGRTSAKIVFPVSEFPKEVKTVKVRLVGTLPGSGYGRILSSETMEITLKE